MNARSAAWYRTQYNDISGDTVLGTGGGDETLVTVKTPVAGAGEGAYTIYIQELVIYITTDAAQSWAFEDSASTPIGIFKVTTSPGVDTRWAGSFGSRGVPLTEAKNFLLNVSATGLAGHIEWEGYERMTGAANLDTRQQ